MAEPLRVVHVSTPLSWRGGEQQLLSLHGELDRLGVAQHVVCAPGSAVARAVEAAGGRVVALPRLTGLDPRFARSLAAACRAARADVVHAHDAHAHTAAAVASVAFGLRAPVVVHRRIAIPPGRDLLSRWKWNAPGVRRILCVSQAVAAAVRPLLRDPDRLEVVPDGLDRRRFEGARADGRLRRELGAPPGVPLVGNFAALGRDKDPLTFVEAAARLVAAGVEARFVLVGEGPLRREVEARVAALGLRGRLTLAGFRSDVPAILPELDLLLFTSATEGFGSTLLEAFASGVPVVATRAGGIPEVVEEEVSGLLAEPGDAAALAAQARRVLADPALAAALRQGGRRRLEAFSAERMAQRTLEAYRRLAG